MADLLLVEFAASDRFHRAVTFPFLHGLARSNGLRSRWLRFGLEAARAMNQEGHGIVLDDSDRGHLLEVIAAHRPRLVVFHMRPDQHLLGMAQAASPGSELACLGDDQGAGAGSGRSNSSPGRISTRQLASRLAGKTIGNLFESARPDYSFEPVNELAARMEPLPFLFLGEECLYNRPFSRNSFLAGLDLTECVRRGGCTFCIRPPNHGTWRSDPLVLFRRQLGAIRDTLPVRPRRLSLRLVGEPAWRRIEAICGYAARNFEAPLDLLVDCRADSFLRWRTRLKRALARLRGSPHRLEMSLVGVENFSSGELHRLNKGLNPATNLAAIGLLFELEHRYGRNFGFRRHGGLSLITFTPWTRPADLALNLAVVEALEIEPLCGKLLTGRLRLYPELPLYQAARRDGLLIEAYQDPLLETARVNMYRRETPWRFRHPLMETLNLLLVRLNDVTTEEQQDEDELTQRLRRVGGARLGEPRGRVKLAQELLDLALTAPRQEHLDAGRLLDMHLEKHAHHPEAPPPPSPGESWPDGDVLPDFNGEVTGLPAIWEVLLDVQPVRKIEPLRESEVHRLQESRLLPHASLRRRTNSQQGDIFELFIGRRARDVEQAVRLANDMDQASGTGFRRMVRRMGRLLGYPDCCARAFAAMPAKLLDDNFHLLVARRIASPGQVSWYFNPAGNPLLEYIPCSLHCHASRDRYKQLLSLAARGKGKDMGNFLAGSLRNPRIIFRGQQGSFVELLPEQQPGNRFRYRTGAIQGKGSLVEAVVRGDELIIEPECLIVLSHGREVAVLSARAYVWWHRRAFQVDFWRALLQQLPRVSQSASSSRTEAAASPPAPPEPSPNAQRLASFLERVRSRGIAFTGYHIEGIELSGGERLCITLTGPGKPLVLDIAPRQKGAPCYLPAGRLLLTYPLSHPLDTPAQEAAARALANFLTRKYKAP